MGRRAVLPVLCAALLAGCGDGGDAARAPAAIGEEAALEDAAEMLDTRTPDNAKREAPPQADGSI